MNKDELRAYYKKMRNEMPAQKKAVLDLQINSYLMQYDLSGLRNMHIFLPIAKWNEFDTFPFIQWLRLHHPELEIVVSMTDMAQGTLQHYVWREETLHVNAWGIPELIVHDSSINIAASALDLVFIPLLVCDVLGNRIGYGKGFYDRFLLNCREDVQKVGISYFPPLDQPIPADAWDVPLDRLISPNGVIEFLPVK